MSSFGGLLPSSIPTSTNLLTLRDKRELSNPTSLRFSVKISLTADSAPHFILCLKKYRTGPKSISTPVSFRPPAAWYPDWSNAMIFMQLATRLIHYHVLLCVIICFWPKGNIIILLSPLWAPLELKEGIWNFRPKGDGRSGP